MDAPLFPGFERGDPRGPGGALPTGQPGSVATSLEAASVALTAPDVANVGADQAAPVEAPGATALATPVATVRRPRFAGRPSAIAAPRPDEERDLERLAALVVRRVTAGEVPATWRVPGTAAQVDEVRRHLAPLCSRVLLAFAYARESQRIARLRALAADPLMPPLSPSPVDLAYAVRWIEMGPDAIGLPAWLDWLDGLDGG